MVFGQNLKSQFRQKSISSERASREEQNDTKFSSIVRSYGCSHDFVMSFSLRHCTRSRCTRLYSEQTDRVRHISCVVLDPKLHGPQPLVFSLHKVAVAPQLVVKLRQERLVRSLLCTVGDITACNPVMHIYSMHDWTCRLANLLLGIDTLHPIVSEHISEATE